MSHSARRLQRIGGIANVKSYLEIGVETGATFNSLTFEEKTAVDPSFRFNTSNFAKDGVLFYEESSDIFFSRLEPKVKFDLAFIDGLHTFDQAYRDFCHCLNHAKRKSIIVLNDTIPCDRFSAMRDATACVEERSRATSEERSPDLLAWHGDTYKALLLIKLFHPYLDYATIVGDGNPQTIVWNSRILSRKLLNKYLPPYSSSLDTDTLINSVTCLGNCGYDWFCVHRKELLHECREDDLMSFLEMLFQYGS
jgi:hypothetical protein